MIFSNLIVIGLASSTVTALDFKSIYPQPGVVECGAEPMESDAWADIQTESFCRHPIIVPHGKVAYLRIANKEPYCDRLRRGDKEEAQIITFNASLVNFCASNSRSFFLPEGTHYIGVSHNTIPIRISLAYHNTVLDCNDIVRSSLVGVDLTFAPTKPKCSIVLPGRTVLHFKNIERTDDSQQNPRLCPRVRMGQNTHSLNTRWQPLCELPSDDTIEYDLGCGAVVLDSSSLAIRKVEFILTPMTGLKAVTAPLLCSDADLGWAAAFPPL